MGEKKLVIVESPSKSKTIKKYLGNDYEVIASMGHIIDLPASKLGVDPDNNFEASYIQMRGKAKLVKEIKQAAKKADFVYLATDPDREGEASAWHIKNVLNIADDEKCRITFNEITKKAVESAIKNARTLDMDLVNAQQARRILDRIVGYKLSPVLWKKVRKGLSAGRVQSVALRIILDRENEIRNFQKEEYWNLGVMLAKGSKKPFLAKFYGDKDGKIEVKNEKQAQDILDIIDGNKYIVESVKEGEKRKNPPAPFTTSTLQQDASRKLGYTIKKVMMQAQVLYEAGYITYMRTDSVRLSDEAKGIAKKYIESNYGKEYYLDRTFKAKKDAQDAHEAIRPTNLENTYIKVEEELGKDAARLYKLITNRFLASQMACALYKTMQINIDNSGYIFRVTGNIIKFDGFRKLYLENEEEQEEQTVPDIRVNDSLTEVEKIAEQKFTEPPARYTEASLVKTLEEKGIGRPSTYAPTISTILDRMYIEKQNRNLVPTELGEIVNNVMTKHFKDIVDIEFTANMEQKLDNVAEGKVDYINMLKEFYDPFMENLEKEEDKIERVVIPDVETDIKCELCGRNMVIKQGRYGKFLACPGFPECKNAKPIVEEIDIPCPKCGGKILIKKTKKGRKFYVCENSPEKCDYISWNKPKKEE